MILICEPQCVGFEHVPVNSALLAVVCKAFKEEEVLFLAEKSHLKHVKKALCPFQHAFLKYQEISVPLPKTPDWARFSAEWHLCREVLSLARKAGASKVLFSSITSPGLMVLKILGRRYQGIERFVIPHGILESLARRPSLIPWQFPFWFRFALGFGSNKGLHFIVLGESIAEQLVRRIPNLRNHVQFVDHPYIFKDVKKKSRFVGERVRFGSIGVAHRVKGSALFFRLAKEVSAKESRLLPEFVLVGHIGDVSLRNAALGSVKVPHGDAPLDRERFESLGEDLDYSLFFYGQNSYRLTASGAFFDALSFAKPIIALNNPFFEYYFRRFGDIGYLCRSYEELLEVVLRILEGKEEERYSLQRQHILEARRELSIERLAKHFKQIMEEG